MKLTLQYLTAAILLAGAARQLVQLARTGMTSRCGCSPQD